MVKPRNYSESSDRRQAEFATDFLVIQDLVKAYPSGNGGKR